MHQRNNFEADTSIGPHFDDLIYRASISNCELPNQSVKTTVSEILSFLHLKEIELTSFYPLFEGGVALGFRVDNIKYLVELFNDNEDVFSIEEMGQPIKAWDLNHSNLLKILKSSIK